MNTAENNKLIAEFMGYSECPMKLFRMDDNFSSVNILSEYQDEDEYLTIEAGTRTIKFAPKDMEFHSSWDWLMPVVGKLSNQCEEPEELDNLRMCLLCNDIEGAYSEVVSLIENL